MISTVLENATIVDGTGRHPYTTDVGIVRDRVALIGDLHERDAVARLDCTGKTLAPGFIDTHSHGDERWLRLPRAQNSIAQGITTEIGGNCGRSVLPLAEFFESVQDNGTALNVATLAGLSTARDAAAGEPARLVREACEQGALGVSSGPLQPPASYADLGELVAAASAARDANAPIYVTHLRNEESELLAAVDEAIAVGRRAQVAVHCSHHRAAGKEHWGSVHRTLAQIDAARSSGIDVSCDAYPYVTSWRDLAAMLPPGTTPAELDDPQKAPAIALALNLRWAQRWQDVLVTDAGCRRNANLAGARLDEIARRWRVSPAHATIRLLRDEGLDVHAAFFDLCQDDVAAVLSAQFCAVGSHPYVMGTFPRIFGRFVRGRRTLDLVEAVRRMTALPASIFGLRERGSVTVGHYADLVVFDAATIADTATYESPHRQPIGIDHVFVNGEAVLRDRAFTSALPGRVLRGGGR